MKDDPQYEHALAAALVIIDEYDLNPSMPKNERLARTLFVCLEAIKRCDEEQRGEYARFSVN